ncbi:M23 family metallopeptidase [uncultured Alistipes sp.]|uniref:M23 family metallopeptidase n=1 Tax=uncultured Alistipes sp. TaxID=538949 RepID=UPI00261448C4|nr:M23 family metallopeptidase [uncultured Alistipes sp.]
MRKLLLTLLFAGGLQTLRAQEPASGNYRFPVRNVAGYYSANFGEMRPGHFHSGVDIKTDGTTGKPVVAAADGYVVRVAVSPGGYGRALYIAHPDGTTTVYGHLRRFRTDIESYLRYKRYEEGRSNVDFVCKPSLFPVRAGDTIALSGNSGMSFGPHLHFEIRRSSDQRTLNVLAERALPVKDRTAPRIMRLHYIEIDSLGDVPVYGRRQSCDLARDDSGTYRLRQTQPLAVGRRGYFLLECSDRKDDVYNTFGIYRLTGKIDGEVYYEYRMEGFLFSDTRYCNAVSYYPLQLSSRNEVFRLAQPAGCPDKFYTAMKNRGLLTASAGQHREVEMTVEDDSGNRSVLRFTVEGKADERCFRAKRNDTSPVIRHDREFRHESDGVRITIPAGTLYESCFYTQRPYEKALPKDSALVFLSRGVTLLDILTPLHRAATVSIEASDVPAPLQPHTILASLSHKGTLRYEGGRWSNGRITLSTRSLGTFFVVADTVPPTIRPRFEPTEMGRRRSITFAIGDNFSGIVRRRCTIDGRMAILEEDRVKGTVTHIFDDEIFGRNREHTMRIEIADGAGNATVWEGTYYR